MALSMSFHEEVTIIPANKGVFVEKSERDTLIDLFNATNGILWFVSFVD